MKKTPLTAELRARIVPAVVEQRCLDVTNEASVVQVSCYVGGEDQQRFMVSVPLDDLDEIYTLHLRLNAVVLDEVGSQPEYLILENRDELVPCENQKAITRHEANILFR